ncbi:MAG: nicotinate phosphoribosyltransferase [Nitrososphaerota archaeon]|jgi:nicotinate phosphoribosyltransferase|nr:nicotinate phosphoribosyltransferase [Nitrososphaerota archaeon]
MWFFTLIMNAFLGYLNEKNRSLFTDYYELTMCAAYYDNQNFEPATFDLFIRRLPQNRSYFLFAGLEEALNYLQTIKFTGEQLAYLKKQGFRADFLKYLKNFRFTGEVWAIPEGTIAFPNEPLLRITAPIIEAQLIETFLLNSINLQTMIATKASRVVQAAQGKAIIEFGLRREPGIDAGIKVARSSYIAGCQGTSNVLAGMTYGIPVFGTMAHSFIMAYPKEIDAFRAFSKTFPDKSTLLIDTYDDTAGAEKAAVVAKELAAEGFCLGGVRLDSGDLAETSRKIRVMLDNQGLDYVKIFASGDLDEYKVTELLEKTAPIDSFGVGTKMGTSADQPYLDVIYKLCETQNADKSFSPIMKLSKDKNTLPGRKQVYRFRNGDGSFKKDKITLADESADGEAMLVKVMDKGKLTYSLPSLNEIRSFATKNLAQLPQKYKTLVNTPSYPVELSVQLQNLMKMLKIEIAKKESIEPV